MASTASSARRASPSTPLSFALLLELGIFALLALAPLVPYLVLLLREGAPRYSLYADLALMEHEVRHVWNGETLLGLGSRFRWHHPGPFLFYVCAPFERLWASSNTGLFIGTWLIAAVAACAPVVATRRYATRAHAVGVLIVFLAWFAAFGNLAVNPWVRTVVVLPLVGYIVLMALFARGASGVILPAAFLGTVVVHTHVASVSTVGGLGALSVVAFIIVRWRAGFRRKDWVRLGLTAFAVALAFAPILIEERRALPTEGNISKLLYFAKMREEPFRPWPQAFKNWVLATSWLPDRLVSLSLLEETHVPQVMSWVPVPIGIARTARVILAVQGLFVAVATGISIRRRDSMSLVFLAFGAIGSVLSISALRALLGEEHYSLVFWTIAPGTVAWMGVFSAFGTALTPRIVRWRNERPLFLASLIGLGFAAAMLSVSFNRDWLARNHAAPGASPENGPALRQILGTIKSRLVKENAVPVIHMAGGWTWATAAVLELEKDGVDVRIADADLWSYQGSKAAGSAPRVVHLWFEIPADPLPLAPCLDLLVQQGAVKAYASAADVAACPTRSPDHAGP